MSVIIKIYYREENLLKVIKVSSKSKCLYNCLSFFLRVYEGWGTYVSKRGIVVRSGLTT